MTPKDLKWTHDIDQWLAWRLNKLTFTVRNLDSAYWTKFRGLFSLSGRCQSTYLGHVTDNILNSPITKDFVKGIYEQNASKIATQIGYKINNKRCDKIENLNFPAHERNIWIKCLKNNGVFYSSQLVVEGRWLNKSEIDAQNWNAPNESNKWNNWITRLSDILSKSTLHPVKSLHPDILEQGFLREDTYFTDGSLKNDTGSAGYVTGALLNTSKILSPIGKKDINNFELQAIEAVCKDSETNASLEIITDSLNSKLFVDKVHKLDDRTIQKLNNRAVKMRIIFLILCKNLRSHADDTTRRDHEKRKTQNEKNFGERLNFVTAGNKSIDEKTGENRDTITSLTEGDLINNYYITDANGVILDGNHRKILYSNFLQDKINRLKKNQKRYSQFFHEEADPAGFNYPRKPFGNLSMKIETVSVWTNYKKQQMGDVTVESPWCENCEDQIMEHHTHSFGNCKIALNFRENVWKMIMKILKDNNVCSTFSPWMSTRSKTTHDWDLDEEICNRGMIPKKVRATIAKENPHLSGKAIEKIMKLITESVSLTNNNIWLARLKKIEGKNRNNRCSGAQKFGPSYPRFIRSTSELPESSTNEILGYEPIVILGTAIRSLQLKSTCPGKRSNKAKGPTNTNGLLS